MVVRVTESKPKVLIYRNLRGNFKLAGKMQNSQSYLVPIRADGGCIEVIQRWDVGALRIIHNSSKYSEVVT